MIFGQERYLAKAFSDMADMYQSKYNKVCN